MIKVIVSGIITNHPELKAATKTGQKFCQLYVKAQATKLMDYASIIKSGDMDKVVNFRVSTFDALAEFSAKYLFQHSRVLITGQINMLQYKDVRGNMVNQLHIIATSVESLNTKEESESLKEKSLNDVTVT